MVLLKNRQLPNGLESMASRRLPRCDKLTGRDKLIKRYHSNGIKHREQSGWIYKEQTDINICIENK